MKYRKKPIVVDAVQWLQHGDHPAIQDFVYSMHDPCDQCGNTPDKHGWYPTREGGHIVCPGDWIITGVAGEHYPPCKPHIFAQIYESAE